LIEAAYLDGASEWGIVRKVIIPMTKPAISTIAILSFQSAWGSVEASNLYINNDAYKTFAYYITSFTSFEYLGRRAGDGGRGDPHHVLAEPFDLHLHASPGDGYDGLFGDQMMEVLQRKNKKRVALPRLIRRERFCLWLSGWRLLKEAANPIQVEAGSAPYGTFTAGPDGSLVSTQTAYEADRFYRPGFSARGFGLRFL
jgi:hypothetical protein